VAGPRQRHLAEILGFMVSLREGRMAPQDSISARTSTPARSLRGLRWSAVWALACCWCLGGCSDEKVVVAEQCPGPHDSRATIDPGMAAPVDGGLDAGLAEVYGTSCAPCEGSEPRLDARGCPIFVTFESCGGDICFGSVRVTVSDPDAGTDPLDTDAGEAVEDAGAES
jgi:hypothetical protein